MPGKLAIDGATKVWSEPFPRRPMLGSQCFANSAWQRTLPTGDRLAGELFTLLSTNSVGARDGQLRPGDPEGGFGAGTIEHRNATATSANLAQVGGSREYQAMETERKRGRLPRLRLPFRSDTRPAELAAPQIGGVSAPAPELPPGRFNDSLRAFQHRNYRLFYTGQSVSLIGTWMQTAAQAWLVTELTNSELALGLVTLMQFLPIMLLVLPAGVIADRVPKRNFLVMTQSLAMLQALILAALVISGHAQLWEVYILAAMLGLSSAFDMPARQSFAIEMVGREDLLNAIALNSAMFNGARLIGPAIGGFIIAGAGVEAVFVLNGLSFIPILVSLYMIRQGELFASTRRPPANPLKELKEGISYAWKTPSTRLIIIMVAMIGTFGYNFTVMLPLLDKHVLGEGSVAFGFLIAAVGLGSLISSLLVAGRKAATRTQLFAGAAVFSLLLGAVAASQNLYLTMALLAGVGAAGTVFATTANTSIQIASPDYMRGRVVSLYMLLFAGSTPIGGFIMGAIAALIDTQTAVAIFAALCLFGTALGAIYFVRNRAAILQSADARNPAAHASG